MSLDIKTAEGYVALTGLRWHSGRGPNVLDKHTCFYCSKPPTQLLVYNDGNPRNSHAWLACDVHVSPRIATSVTCLAGMRIITEGGRDSVLFAKKAFKFSP